MSHRELYDLFVNPSFVTHPCPLLLAINKSDLFGCADNQTVYEDIEKELYERIISFWGIEQFLKKEMLKWSWERRDDRLLLRVILLVPCLLAIVVWRVIIFKRLLDLSPLPFTKEMVYSNWFCLFHSLNGFIVHLLAFACCSVVSISTTKCGARKR